MSRVVMPHDDIRKLCRILRELFLHYKRIKEEEPLARKIKSPQVPQDLSESLVYHLIERGDLISNLQGWTLTRGLGNRDLTAESDGVRRIIEVKATAGRGWQRLSSKDVTADYLVWVDFGKFFELGDQVEITVYVVSSPGNYFRSREDVFVSGLKRKARGGLQQQKVFLRV